MSDSDRRYSDAEVRKIIEKALELQTKLQRRDKTTDGGGVPIGDIDAVAREVGISSEMVRRAAAEINAAALGGRRNRFLGGSANIVQVRSASRNATSDELEKIITLLPALTGESGSGNVIGDTLTWSTGAEAAERTGYSTDVIISPSPAGSIIKARCRLGNLAGGIFGGFVGGIGLGAGLGVGLGVGIPVLGSVLFSVLFPLCTLVVSYVASRFAFRGLSKKPTDTTREMADRLQHLLSADPAGQLQQ